MAQQSHPTTQVGHVDEDSIDEYIGRADGGDAHLMNTEVGERGWLGNPFTVEEYGRDVAVAKYVNALFDRLEAEPEFRSAVKALQGSVLGCHCQTLDEDEPLCHGQPLADAIDNAVRHRVVTDGTEYRGEVARRLKLLQQARAIEPGTRLTMTWDSSRGGEVSATGDVVEGGGDQPLALEPDDRDAKLYVDPRNPENELWGGIAVRSKGREKTTTIGELLFLETEEDDE